MYDRILEVYIHLITNIQVLLKNPVNSAAIDVLRIFSIVLLVRFLFKIFIHSLIFVKLKKKFIPYDYIKNRNILNLFYSNCRKIKLKRIPLLLTFSEEKPLIFSIGIFRPAVFLSPRLISDLSRDEIEAALLHELQHIKRHDSLWLWLFEFFMIFIPVFIILIFGYLIVFNIIAPYLFIIFSVSAAILFSKYVKSRFIFYRELECDDLTIKIIKDPLLLASSLIKVWRIGNKLPRFNYLFSLFQIQPFITASQKVENRIKRLTDYNGPSKRIFRKKTFEFIIICVVILSSLFLLDFCSFYKKTNCKAENGKILIKSINSSENSEMDLSDVPDKNLKRKYIYRNKK